MAGVGPISQDWEPVAIRKKAPNAAAKKDEKAVNAARRTGADIETVKKYNAGTNKASSSSTSLNAKKLDDDTENLTHDRVPIELKKNIMQARMDKKLTQSQLSTDGEGGSGFAAAAAAGVVSGFDLGVDPNLDPELALTLRVSMEEERARQEAAAKKAAEEASKHEKGGEGPSSQDATVTEGASASCSGVYNKKDDLMDDESSLLQRALAMSLDNTTSSHHELHDTDMLDAAVDDPELALALQMSVQDGATDSSCQSEMTKLLEDQSFIPGVDPNDPSVKELLDSMHNQSEKGEDPKGPNQEEEK